MLKITYIYRFGLLQKVLLFLGLFLALGTTGAFAQFAVTEDFRGSGNADIIIGDQATLTSGNVDPVNQGWLRLTTDETYKKGHAYINKSFPSTLGVLVDFEYKIWRDTNDGFNGADGIGVFLFDGNIDQSTFVLGAYGGSLGYIGLKGGYVGIGIDEFGNFANPNDGGKRGGALGNGVEAFRPNSIVMRGPTTTNNTDNVVGGVQPTNRYLSGRTIRATTNAGVTTYTYNDIVTNQGVGTENAIDYNTVTATRPTDATMYRRVQIIIQRSTASGGQFDIIVKWKTDPAPTAAFTEITRYTTTDVPPGLLKLGFAASTGGGINYHEIRNLLVTTPNNVRVVKRADKEFLKRGGTTGTDNLITYTIEITNDTDFAAPNIAFSDILTDADGNPIAKSNGTTAGFYINPATTGTNAGVKTSGFTSSNLTLSTTTNNVTGTVALAANTTGTVTITGRLINTVPEGNLLVNTVTATPPYEDDNDLNNNTSTVKTPVNADGIDLMLVKTDLSNPCIENAAIVKNFEIRVSNIGQASAPYRGPGSDGNRIVIAKTVPNGYNYDDSATPGGFSTNNTTSRWAKYSVANLVPLNTTTYYYVAKYPYSTNSNQTLAAGATYETAYPITYSLTIPANTNYTDEATVSYITSTSSSTANSSPTNTRSGVYTGTNAEGTNPTDNRLNNTVSSGLYVKPAAPAVSNVYYCQGATAQALTATKSNTSYSLKWYFSASGGFSSDFAPTPTTDSAASQSYWVSQMNGTCEGPRSKIDVFISSTPTAGAIATNQNICSGATASTITSQTDGTIGLGAISYRWEQSVNGGAWATIANATASTYAPGVLTSTTAYRRYTVSKNGTGTTSPAGSNCESSATNTVTVTVSAPTPGVIAADQTVCYNTAPAAITTASGAGNAPTGAGNLTYRWEFSSNGGAWTLVSGVSTESYTPGALTVNTRYRRYTLSNSTVSGNTVSCTSAVSNIVTIEVQGQINPGTITPESTQTICANSRPNPLTNASDASLSNALPTSALTYRWEFSANGSTGWATIPNGNATGASYTFPTSGNGSTLAATTYYRRVAVFTRSPGGKVCEQATNNVVVTVGLPSAGSIAADQIICKNSAPSLLTSATNGAGTASGTLSYQWYSSNDPVNNFNPINLAVDETYQPGNLSGTTYYSRTTKSTNNGVTCESARTTPVKITVVEFPTPGQLTNADKYACYNTAPTEIVSTGAGTGTDSPTITYAWQQTTDAANTVWSGDIAGATSANYTPGPLTQTTSFRRFTIATYPNAQCRSTSSTNVVKVNVSVVPTSGTIKSDQVVCSGSTPANIVNDQQGVGSSGLTYLWQTSTDNVTWNNASGVNPDFQTSAITQTTYYRRFGISKNGDATCYATTPSNVVTVTVPVTGGGTIAAAQTICSGATPAALTSASGGAGTGSNIKYSWQTLNSSGTWVTIGGATSETYQPGSLVATTQYRRVTTSTATNGSNCSSANSNAITITVTAAVSAGTVAANQVICYNTTPAPLTSTGAGATTNYRWDSSTDGIAWNTTGVTTAGYTFPAPLVATTYYRRATISGSCEGYTATITITVLAETKEGAISGDQSICRDTAPGVIGPGTVGTGAGTLSYEWEISTDNGASWTLLTGTGTTSASYQPPVLKKSAQYRRRTVSTSVISGSTYICKSASTTGTVIVTARKCRVITNPMIYQKVKS